MSDRLLVLSLATTVAACGGEQIAPPPPPPPVAATVAVAPRGASVSGVGATHTFTAQALARDGSAIASTSVKWTSLNTEVATIDELSGTASAVSSGQVVIAATAGDAVGYAVLTVSVPGAARVRTWTLDTVPELPTLSVAGGGLWGTSPTNVYAVGAGTPLHYDGTGWRPFIGRVHSLGGVWGASANDIFVVGLNDLYRFDGTTWTHTFQGPGVRVWGSAPNDVYAVSSFGGDRHAYIRHFDGARWTPEEFPGRPELTDIWGAASNDIFAVGNDGLIMHYDGRNWSVMPSGVSSRDHFRGVWGTSGRDVYAVALTGTMVHYNGVSWREIDSGTDAGLWAIWGTSPTDIYVTTQAGVRHFDGTRWILMPFGVRLHFAIWGTSVGDVFVLGDDLHIYRGRR
jgi:hypothetical protein